MFRDAKGRFVPADRARSAEAADKPTPLTLAQHTIRQRSLMGYTLSLLGKPVFEGVRGGQRAAADRRHAKNRISRKSRRRNRNDRGSAATETAIRFGSVALLAGCALAYILPALATFARGY